MKYQRNISGIVATVCLLGTQQTLASSNQSDKAAPGQKIRQHYEAVLKLPHKDRLAALENAQRIARDDKDLSGEALVARESALYAVWYGQPEKAIQYANRAIHLSKRLGNRALEALSIDVLAAANCDLGKTNVGLKFLGSAKKIQEEINDMAGQATSLDEIGSILGRTGDNVTAIEVLGKALAIRVQSSDQHGEAETLDHLGSVQFVLGKTSEANQTFSKALLLWKAVGDPVGESATLDHLGHIFTSSGDQTTAKENYLQALALQIESHDRKGEAESECGIGEVLYNLGQPNESFAHFSKALNIRRELKYPSGIAESLSNIGLVLSFQGQSQKALQNFKEALDYYRQADDLAAQATVLTNIGAVSNVLVQPRQAREAFNQAFVLQQKTGDARGQAKTLNNIGESFDLIGQKAEAIAFYQRALPILQRIGDRDGVSITLGNLGGAFADLGQFGKAFKYEQQALATERETKNLNGQAVALGNIGCLYYQLGQTSTATTYLSQALETYTQQKDDDGISVSLSNLGKIFLDKGDVSKALSNFQQALKIAKDADLVDKQCIALNGIALAHKFQKLSDIAHAEFSQVLAINRKIKDRQGEADALRNLALIHLGRHETNMAIDLLQQALFISRRIGNRPCEAELLKQFGVVYSLLGQDRLAILSLKLSVDIYQTLRVDSKSLTKADQEAFKNAGAATYRQLADLLISQGRLSEAQSVLDLLKDAELFDFLRTTTSKKVYFTKREGQWKRNYDRFIENLSSQAFEYDRLAALPSRNSQEEERMMSLARQLGRANVLFAEFIKNAETDFSSASAQRDRVIRLETTGDLASVLSRMPQKTAAIYTLVTDESVRTILSLPSVTELTKGPVTPIARKDLLDKIHLLRQALTDPHFDPLPICGELYDILIRPMESELSASQVKHLMFSLDGPLRYIPVGALYDNVSKQYLFQKYTCSLFTPGDLSSISLPPAVNPSGAGFGVSTPLRIGDDTIPGLSSVLDELEAFHRTYNATIFENQEFTQRALVSSMFRHPAMVHIASHFDLNPGDASNSFLLLGTGERLSMDDLSSALPQGGMTGVDLIVLSACDTATPAGDETDGGEYESFAVVTKRFGAHAVLASLWSVNDATTASLMSKFYEFLKEKPGDGKLVALQRAQLWLKDSSGKSAGTTRSVQQSDKAGQSEKPRLQRFKVDPNHPFAHPFYWAPFVLTGNGG